MLGSWCLLQRPEEPRHWARAVIKLHKASGFALYQLAVAWTLKYINTSSSDSSYDLVVLDLISGNPACVLFLSSLSIYIPMSNLPFFLSLLLFIEWHTAPPLLSAPLSSKWLSSQTNLASFPSPLFPASLSLPPSLHLTLHLLPSRFLFPLQTSLLSLPPSPLLFSPSLAWWMASLQGKCWFSSLCLISAGCY